MEVKSVKNNVKDFWDDHYSSDFDASIEVDGKLFTAEKTTELKNKFLLIISCGTGEHVVRASRQGANVVALDISSKAIRNAQEMMKLHDLQADYIVADAGNTGLPNQAFDIIWGNAVLHHLDHKKCSSEVARLLKPGGMVFFVEEPTFFNPILKFAYEFCFGKGRDGRRKKFLFIERGGDEFEKPIDKNDLVEWSEFFHIDKQPQGLMFFEKISQVVSFISHNSRLHRLLRGFDYYLLKFFPALKKYGYEYNFIMTLK